ncbi:PspC domain-containing protein [Bacillus cereus group sp. TH152-1LC]|uniref:PspC domain-containing protein n=1 Tax=Bacillus cereus group sp. TH152-1LC TaxID=3018060 RepID=UPI0022E318AA|nr:PspC domain-containing protein [Bacillus cereus group sp. TH152-1LC]MDA1674688.1 PspC domain-containing protein [Bacillus cereus group sp. TH152-1LC]
MKRKLFRSRSDKKLSGVLGGIGALTNIDATILRIVFALFTLFTGVITGVFVYIIFALIMPMEPKHTDVIEVTAEEPKKADV